MEKKPIAEENFLTGSYVWKCTEQFWADPLSPFCATCGIHCSVSPPRAAGRSSARQSWRPERRKVLNLTCMTVSSLISRGHVRPLPAGCSWQRVTNRKCLKGFWHPDTEFPPLDFSLINADAAFFFFFFGGLRWQVEKYFSRHPADMKGLLKQLWCSCLHSMLCVYPNNFNLFFFISFISVSATFIWMWGDRQREITESSATEQ